MDDQRQGAAEPGSGDDNELVCLRADPELAGMFFAEALDHLGSIEATVLALESAPGDTRLLNDLFRPFHTIKGNAGALGVTSVQDVAHVVENLLDLGRSGRHPIEQAEIEVILRAVDVVTTMLKGIKLRLEGQTVPDVSAESLALVAEVERIIAVGPAAAGPAPEATEGRGAAPGPVLAPAADWLLAPLPDPAPDPVPLAPAERDLLAAPAQPKPETVTMDTVKIDTRKLDNLVDMVGELVIVEAMIQEDPTLAGLAGERLARNLGQLKRITSDLQRTAMAMRMVPVRQTFQRMARLVRDVGKKSGKLVELELAGEDTELDRQVVEDINDPLMHMIRNSIDHGIEDAATRAKSGKAPQGHILLSAYHQGGSVVISVADDGAGLNVEKIRARAVAQGLVAPDQVLGEAETHHLIFQPGFSTADKVTELSGRGVGLDVVRRNVEALRGRVEIVSVPGRGTTFLFRLPLTLAILDGLLLRAAGQRFVLPVFAASEALRPRPEQIHCIQGQPRMIQVRDTLVPLASLPDLLGIDEKPRPPSERTAVVVDDGGQRIALLVDELIGKQEVVIKSLGSAFSKVRGIAGGAILGDGRVGLILDAAGLTSLIRSGATRAA